MIDDSTFWTLFAENAFTAGIVYGIGLGWTFGVVVMLGSYIFNRFMSPIWKKPE